VQVKERAALVILGLSVFGLCSCSSPPSGTGTVEGVFETIGGLAGHGPHRLPGTTVFTTKGGGRTSVKVANSGKFLVALAPGTYVALGHSSQVRSDGQEMDCYSLKPVVIQNEHSVSVTVACQIH
jgi:hypothetical protein